MNKFFPPLLMVRHNALMGEPVDYNRPQIQNPDGSMSTEETITIPRGGKWYNVPTIVNGRRVDPGLVENLFQTGRIPHVGEFGTLFEAENSARYRTNALSTMRDPRELPQKKNR